MRRFHLFEIEDQNWFPVLCRNYLTDFLEAVSSISRVYDTCLEPLGELQRRVGQGTVLDLCSGAGGPWPRWLQQRQFLGQVILSDRYPNLTAFERQSLENQQLRYCAQTVEALSPPGDLAAIHTLFTALHHLTPLEVRQLMERHQNQGIALGAFDFNQRTWPTIVGVPLAALLLNWILTPWLRPFSWKRLALTYLLPVVPLAAAWDGFASQLRAYTESELRQMADEIHLPGYRWRVETRYHWGFFPVTCLLGWPEPEAEVGYR